MTVPAAPDITARFGWAAALAGLAVATFALYWNGLSGGFIFDDFPNLVTDPGWRMTRITPDQMMRAFGDGIASSVGRGLAMVTFGLNHVATGMDPWPLKLTNVAMHVVAGVLVLLLTRRVFRHLVPKAPGTIGAVMTAAAWLWHPLQVSTVLYVVQRMEIGAAMGVLAACIFYFEGRCRELRGRHGRPFLILAGLATVVGLGFKETALLTPAFTGLLEVLVLRFETRGGRRSRVWLTVYAVGLVAAAILYCGYVVPHYTRPEAYAGRDFGPAERLLTQPRVLATYLGQILLPLPERLRFYYDDLVVSTGWRNPLSTIFSMGLVLALAVTAVWQARRRPLVSLGIGWFLIAHVLTSNIVPLELAFEHRNYLALLGVLWAVAGFGIEVTARFSTEATRTIAAALLAGLAAACWVQASTWGDPTKLAIALESRAPGSSRAAYGVGRALYGLSGGDPSTPAWSMARAAFSRAGALDTHSILADQALLLMDARAGRPTETARWQHLRSKAMAHGSRPENVQALYSLVDCSLQSNCAIDRTELGRTLVEASRHAPRDPDIRIIHANFLLNVAGNPLQARREAVEAVRLSPRAAEYRIALVRVLLASGAPDDRRVDALISQLHRDNPHGELDDALADIDRLRTLARNSAKGVTPSP